MLNNSEQAASGAVPTYLRKGGFSRVYGTGPAHLTTDRANELAVSMPGLSTVVYRSDARIPRSAQSAR